MSYRTTSGSHGTPGRLRRRTVGAATLMLVTGIVVAPGAPAGAVPSDATAYPGPGVSAGTAVAAANTFTVDSRRDAPDRSPGDGRCNAARGDATPVCTLRAATTEANASGRLTKILLPAGTYRLTRASTDRKDGDAVGDLNLDDAGGVILQGTGGHPPVIDASALAGGDRVLSVGALSASTAPAAIDGVRLSGGDATTSAGTATGEGGGIYVARSGALSLTHAVVDGNSADNDGGGIANDGTLSVAQSAIQRNVAHGGTYGGGGLFNNNDATVNSTTFSGNAAPNGSGGGVFSFLPLVMSHSTLTAGTAAYGGGLYADDNTRLTAVDITGNTATQGYGGGAYLGYPTIWSGGTVSGNTAGSADLGYGYGGGIYGVAATRLGRMRVEHNSAYTDGGGLYLGDQAQLDRIAVGGNHASDSGGGLFATSSVQLANSTVDQNDATNYGGGLYLADTASVSSVRLTGNTAGFLGGAVDLEGSGQLTGITVAHNSTPGYGGGLYLDGFGVSVSRATISSNTAYNGGGIYNNNYVQVSGSTLAGNSATGSSAADGGGGLYNANSLLVNRSTLVNNKASEGSGGAALSNGFAKILNTTMVGNRAGAYGGAVANPADRLTLTAVTVTANSAAQGGGLYSDGDTTVSSSILADNTVTVGKGNCAVGPESTPLSAGHNLESGRDCRFTSFGDRQRRDPLLGPLIHSGAPVRTEVPQPGSPVIDTGGAVCATPTDERGVPRPQGAACDIGAVEVRQS